MNYRKLGASELNVSEISFGAMSLGTDYTANKTLLHRALDLGVNFFDTADLYDKGRNERCIGQVFKGMRNDIILATKVGNQWKEDGSGWIWNPTKAYILQAVDESLMRLQTDYIDLYQLHGGTIEDPIDETIEAFEELVAAGKIRHYGISSIRPNVIRAYLDRSHIVSVMTQYSLLDRRPEEATLDLLHGHEVGVLVRGAVAKGLLVNKPPKDYLAHSLEAVNNIQHQLNSFDQEEGSAAQLALKYSLSHPAVSTVVAGASRIDQLEENVGAVNQSPLSKESLHFFQELIPAYTYEQHR